MKKYLRLHIHKGLPFRKIPFVQETKNCLV